MANTKIPFTDAMDTTRAVNPHPNPSPQPHPQKKPSGLMFGIRYSGVPL